MASFSSQVKKELTLLPVHRQHARAELAALIRMNGTLRLVDHQFVLSVATENPAIARRIYALLKQVYAVEAELLVSRKMNLRKNYNYAVRLQGASHRVLTDLSILQDDALHISHRISSDISSKEPLLRSYLRGAFLAGGSVNDPETSRYHLEIYSTYADHSRDLLAALRSFHLNAKETARRSGYIVYLKEAEQVADFLQLIGATNAMLQFEDVRIVRDMRNSVNRLVNCETANMNKTVNAAARQIENIELIQATVGLSALSPSLREIATIRLAHPEVSLKELGELLPGGPVSKSGVNHRLRKINAFADTLRQGNYSNRKEA